MKKCVVHWENFEVLALAAEKNESVSVATSARIELEEFCAGHDRRVRERPSHTAKSTSARAHVLKAKWRQQQKQIMKWCFQIRFAYLLLKNRIVWSDVFVLNWLLYNFHIDKFSKTTNSEDITSKSRKKCVTFGFSIITLIFIIFDTKVKYKSSKEDKVLNKKVYGHILIRAFPKWLLMNQTF